MHLTFIQQLENVCSIRKFVCINIGLFTFYLSFYDSVAIYLSSFLTTTSPIEGNVIYGRTYTSKFTGEN